MTTPATIQAGFFMAGLPDNFRQPRLGLSGQLLWSGRAKASSVGSTFTLLHGY